MTQPSGPSMRRRRLERAVVLTECRETSSAAAHREQDQHSARSPTWLPPVAALRNVRQALAPGGHLSMVVWRRKLDNEFLHRAELVVADYLEEPEESEAPRCGPGPFSMANADTVTDVLRHAGYEDVRLARQDLSYKVGNDLDQAVALTMAIGPAAEVLRMWGERIAHLRPKIEADLRLTFADCVVEGGAVFASSSTWAVTARAPR